MPDTLLLANNAVSTLAAGINAAATTIAVAAGTGELFPNPGAGEYFKLTIEDRRTQHIEIVHCTARSADTLTIVRAQEDTSAETFLPGSTTSIRITRDTFEAIAANFNESSLFSGTIDVTGTLAITGVITPAQITASQNDYEPTGIATATVLRLSTDATRTITGIAGGTDGRILALYNVGSFGLTLTHQSASSVAANRIILPGSISLLDIKTDGGVFIQYDGTSSRWRVIQPPAARQSEMEGGSVSGNFVTPFYQGFHPSAPKCWGQTIGAGTPVLTTSYNTTSITDTALGRLTVTIATDFSSANYAAVAGATCVTNDNRMVAAVSKAAGTVILESSSAATTLADPGVGWDWVFMGDQ